MIARLLIMLAFGAATLSAQAVPVDSPTVVLMHRDSTSRLTLTTHSVIYEYTQRGVAQEAARADSATARYSDPWLAGIVKASVVGAFRGLRVPIPLTDIASVTLEGTTVRITSFARPAANADESTLEFDAMDEGSARSFVTRLNELLRRG